MAGLAGITSFSAPSPRCCFRFACSKPSSVPANGLRTTELRRTTGPRDYGTTGLRDHGTTGLRDHGTTGLRDHGTTGLRTTGLRTTRPVVPLPSPHCPFDRLTSHF